MSKIRTIHHKLPRNIISLLNIADHPEMILELGSDKLKTLKDDFNRLYIETSYIEFKEYADKINEMLYNIKGVEISTEDDILGLGNDPIF